TGGGGPGEVAQPSVTDGTAEDAGLTFLQTSFLGPTPRTLLNALLKAASESYPTPCLWPTECRQIQFDASNPTRTAHGMSVAIGLLANFELYRMTNASSKFRRGLPGSWPDHVIQARLAV